MGLRTVKNPDPHNMYGGDIETTFLVSYIEGYQRHLEDKPVEGYTTHASAYYTRSGSVWARASLERAQWRFVASFASRIEAYWWLIRALWNARRACDAAGGIRKLHVNQLLVLGAVFAKVRMFGFREKGVECFDEALGREGITPNTRGLATGAICEILLEQGQLELAKLQYEKLKGLVEEMEQRDQPRAYRAMIKYLFAQRRIAEAQLLYAKARGEAIGRGDFDQVNKLDALFAIPLK